MGAFPLCFQCCVVAIKKNIKNVHLLVDMQCWSKSVPVRYLVFLAFNQRFNSTTFKRHTFVRTTCGCGSLYSLVYLKLCFCLNENLMKISATSSVLMFVYLKYTETKMSTSTSVTPKFTLPLPELIFNLVVALISSA